MRLMAGALGIGALVVCLVGATGCGNSRSTSGHQRITIGFSMDSLQLERWQHDRDAFVAEANTLGADVLVQSAEGNDATQVQQAEDLLTDGVDVLVVVPHNGDIAASIVNSAKRQHVPVLSYDRLIRNSEIDFYISFDNVRVGELHAK